MPSVNLDVSEVEDAEPHSRWRWSVSKDGVEVHNGTEAEKDAAFEAAKPHLERLRAALSDLRSTREVRKQEEV